MKDVDPPAFDGLGPALPAFLVSLAENNSREWFRARKADYDRHVAGPISALADDVASTVTRIDDRMVKRLSRPHRDVRFSRNKAPYRTEAWFAFCRRTQEWTDWPAFFFEAAPDGCRWGMGFYSARPATMNSLRNLVAARPEEFSVGLTAARQRGFTMEGDAYRRPRPAPEGSPAEWVELYRRRNCYMSRTSTYSPDLRDSAFARTLAEDFGALAPLYRLFRLALE